MKTRHRSLTSSLILHPSSLLSQHVWPFMKCKDALGTSSDYALVDESHSTICRSPRAPHETTATKGPVSCNLHP